MLRYVTLTGADDGVEISNLVELSNEYSYVEWGILFSKSKVGESRYPSINWRNNLLNYSGMNLAAHLCGGYIADIFNGNFSFSRDPLFSKFSRIQLNLGNKVEEALNSREFFEAIKDCGKTIMLGGDYTDIKSDYINEYVVPLFDISGGRGLPGVWKTPYVVNEKKIFCGYAGGLGVDNIEKELNNISNINNGDFWIDMESSLRSNDLFDLNKCKVILEKVRPWVK
jgi:hypothetical protein